MATKAIRIQYAIPPTRAVHYFYAHDDGQTDFQIRSRFEHDNPTWKVVHIKRYIEQTPKE